MAAPDGLRFRLAGPGDSEAVARLHADSWRRHYRGAFADSFLDDGLSEYLVPLWAKRLADPNPSPSASTCTILAEHNHDLVGLAHVLLGEDGTWGSFVDNLHVAYGLKRQGIGTRLLALTARAALDWSPMPMPSPPSRGLYLWVLEQNVEAQAFYSARGGACVEREEAQPPGGDATRLNGRPMGLRYAWRDASTLLAARPVA